MDLQRARELLAAERERVEAELASARPEDTSELVHGDQHLADEATDLYDAELDEGTADELRDRLRAIERAERRIEEGTYGRSVESGEPISDERLEAIPWAERTIEEQRRFERGV